MADGLVIFLQIVFGLLVFIVTGLLIFLLIQLKRGSTITLPRGNRGLDKRIFSNTKEEDSK